jgi:hypothetical protein
MRRALIKPPIWGLTGYKESIRSASERRERINPKQSQAATIKARIHRIMSANTEDRLRELENESLKARIYGRLLIAGATLCGLSVGWLWQGLVKANAEIEKAQSKIDLAVTNALLQVHKAVDAEAARAVAANMRAQRVTVSGHSETKHLAFFIRTGSRETPIICPARIRGYPQVDVIYCRAETLSNEFGVKVHVRFAGAPKDGEQLDFNLMQLGMKSPLETADIIPVKDQTPGE